MGRGETQHLLHSARRDRRAGREGPRQSVTRCTRDEPYRTLVEQMQEGAVVLTLGGDILYANARFATLVGEPLESVVGSRVDRFVSASDRDDFEILLRAGSGRRRSSLIGQDSGAFEVSLSLTTTASTTGDRLNLIVTDLRELLAANNNRERAERDSRSKDEFLRCWPTSCAIRSVRSAVPSACSR